tara:strand:- start:130 stop:510 length:381 start_codon:yes stop_codon:yes gene_type:complete
MSVVLDTVRLRLHDIAHGRSGDKGNRSNISVIPYADTAYDLLLEQVTEERVLKLFGHKGASAVIRYELPTLPALNFVIDDALEGGVNSTLNLDLHGKTLSFMLLDLPVEVPLERVEEFTKGRMQNQ